MKTGFAVVVRDKSAWSFTLMRSLGELVEWAKKQECDFFYFVDKNKDARNYDVYEKLADFKPFIVETNAPSLIKKLNEIEAPIVSRWQTLAKIKCLCLGCPWEQKWEGKYAIVKEQAKAEEVQRAKEAGMKLLVFEGLPFKGYGVIKKL